MRSKNKNQDYQRRIEIKKRQRRTKKRKECLPGFRFCFPVEKKSEKRFTRLPSTVYPVSDIVYSDSETFGKSFKNSFAIFSGAVVVGSKGGLMVPGAVWAVAASMWDVTVSMWAVTVSM